MKKMIVRILFNAVALALVTHYVPGINYTGGTLGLVAIASVFGLVNLTVKPIISILSLPIKLLTLGLFGWVINGAMLYLTSIIMENFTIENFWFPGIEAGPIIISPFNIPFWGNAIICAFIISLIGGFLNWLVE